ncbi:MAG: TonB-dependent receptor [Thiobacillus sp.]|nr:TonB-dependent receptor [Thiobacillus sp.]MBC2738765.1 TonB-dependent receptor [Thiobacillus sp.]
MSAIWNNAAAQGDASPVLPETPLMTVVVVGAPDSTDAELNSVTLDAASLQPMHAATSDTASLLRDVPGLNLQGAGGVSSLPSIRGLGDDRLRIKVDGMDLIASCPNHMNPALSYIDPTRVDAIKVFAGITPVSVGGDSIGGTLIVESARPQFARAGEGVLTRGSVGTFYRSNGNAMGANAAVTVAGENLSVTYTGSTAQSDNYKAGDNFKTSTLTGRLGHTLPLDEVGSSAYRSINQALAIALRNENHLFDLKLGRQHIPYENFPNQRMDMTDNTSDQVNLGYTGQYQWGVLKARVYHEKTRHEMNFGDDKQFVYGTAPGMPMNSDGKTTGVSVNADIRLSERDTVRVGSEYQAYRPRLTPQWTSLLGLRHETVRTDAGDAAGYCTSGMCMGNQLADSASFNSQDHSRTDRNWDLTALARYTPDATQTYEVGLAQKTRSPNLYERYTWSTWPMAAIMNNFVGDGNGYVGNLDLKPEVAHTLSLAADWHDARQKVWGVRIAPYYTHVRDYIDARCSSASCPDGQFNVLKYVNQSARLVGVDLSGHLLAASTPAYGDFTVSGIVNVTRGENRDTGDNLYNIMPLNAKLALTQKRGRLTNTVEAQFVAAKHTVSDVRNEVETSGYSLFNLRSSYAWKQVRLDVGIDNLFDRGYALPLGGAYVGQGMTMSINGIPWGIAVPGPGRSVYAGVNYQF